ncbi:hypothetical protein IHE44_0008268 [Lamprotornis superbus]|uniref:Uncharacterized protein n=1 Tax=Lamprotornis superbus TaxID=245042 RepID=A0A835NDQ7_9PASS|nr:hypothetical protein IHE44_0008268 [Lamprotornis superbus]
MQWIHNTCGITNEDLEPLMPLLKGRNQANLLCELTEKQQKALTQIATKFGNSFANHWSPTLPFSAAVLNKEKHVMAILMQWDSQAKQPLKILELVFLPFNLSKSLTTRIKAIAKIDSETCFLLRDGASKYSSSINQGLLAMVITEFRYLAMGIVLELGIVIRVFEKWPNDPVNIVSDFLYVVGVVESMERVIPKEIQNQQLWQLFAAVAVA